MRGNGKREEEEEEEEQQQEQQQADFNRGEISSRAPMQLLSRERLISPRRLRAEEKIRIGNYTRRRQRPGYKSGGRGGNTAI